MRSISEKENSEAATRQSGTCSVQYRTPHTFAVSASMSLPMRSTKSDRMALRRTSCSRVSAAAPLLLLPSRFWSAVLSSRPRPLACPGTMATSTLASVSRNRGARAATISSARKVRYPSSSRSVSDMPAGTAISNRSCSAGVGCSDAWGNGGSHDDASCRCRKRRRISRPPSPPGAKHRGCADGECRKHAASCEAHMLRVPARMHVCRSSPRNCERCERVREAAKAKLASAGSWSTSRSSACVLWPCTTNTRWSMRTAQATSSAAPTTSPLVGEEGQLLVYRWRGWRSFLKKRDVVMAGWWCRSRNTARHAALSATLARSRTLLPPLLAFDWRCPISSTFSTGMHMRECVCVRVSGATKRERERERERERYAHSSLLSLSLSFFLSLSLSLSRPLPPSLWACLC